MQKPANGIGIDKVGIKDIYYPIVVRDKKQGKQSTIARVNMFVDLPMEYRGTHMSRFVEILNRVRGDIEFDKIRDILCAIKDHLQAQSTHIEIEFPYFIEKQAPVSKTTSLMKYQCRLTGYLGAGDVYHLTSAIEAPVMTLCPCSKELCEASAHNQRSLVTVTICSRKFIWIEDIIELVEANASAPLYSLLKREDEKYITDLAYNNPRFVEDLVRGIAAGLKEMEVSRHIIGFSIEAENLESIHNHNAYAYIREGELYV